MTINKNDSPVKNDSIKHKEKGAIAIVKAIHPNDVEAIVTNPGKSVYVKGDAVVWRLTDVESVEIIENKR
jgi:hypothetical protein